MKKLFVVIIVFLILIGNIGYQKKFTLLDYFSGDYYAYSNDPISDNYVYLGNCYMNYGKINSTEEIIGESMTIYNFEPVAAIEKLNAKIVFSEYLDNGASVIYAFSDNISRSVMVNNKRVNIQIAYYDDYSIIGWPLILGSF